MAMPPKSGALPHCGNLVQDELRMSCIKVPRGAFTFKVVIVGNPGVGKTSLVYRFAEGRLPAEYRPTLGVNILTKVTHLCRDTDIKWIIWDVGSQRRMEPLRKAFYRGAASVLLVYDKTNPTSLEALETFWLQELAEAKVDLARIPVVIIANKDDLATQDPIVVNKTYILMNGHRFHFIETSAMTGKNVAELFEYLSYRCLLGCSEICHF